MNKLEIEIATMANLYPNDIVLGMEVRKLANKIRMKENQKEKINLESFKQSIDETRKKDNITMIDPETFEAISKEEYKNKYKK